MELEKVPPVETYGETGYKRIDGNTSYDSVYVYLKGIF